MSQTSTVVAARWPWALLTTIAGSVLVLIALIGFIASSATSLTTLSLAIVGLGLCLLATAGPLGRRPSVLIVTTAIILSVSGIIATALILAASVDLISGVHVHNRLTVAVHVAAVPVLVGYILAMVRLGRDAELRHTTQR